MQEEKKESNIDIKGTLEKFIKAEEPELEQEEAIMKYGEEPKKKNKKNDEDSESQGNSEEQEHLIRIKNELIASLRRVEALAKKIFEGNPLGEKEKINVKVDKSSGGGKGNSKIKDVEIESKKTKSKEQKERE